MRGLAAVAVCLAVLATASSARAAEPWWHVSSGARPTDLMRGDDGEVVVTAENVGDAPTVSETLAGKPTPVRVTDTLPPGLRAVGIAGLRPKFGGSLTETSAMSCSPAELACETDTPLAPYEQIEVRIAVEVLPGAAVSEVNEVSVSGGGTGDAQAGAALHIGSESAAFGIEAYELSAEGEGGAPMTQAGSHPYQVTGTIALNQGPDSAPLTSVPQAQPLASARDIVAKLPPGLIADPSTAQRCLIWEFLLSDGLGRNPECPPETAVGVASVTAYDPGHGTLTFPAPVFNIEPEAGEPARFGFFVPGVNAPVLLTTSVRSGLGEDWGVNLDANEIPEGSQLISARVTFWGTPRRASHDDARGWGCLQESHDQTQTAYEACVPLGEEAHPPAFVTMPTSCAGPLQSSLEVDSAQDPGHFETFTPSAPWPALTGCEALAFTPSISTEPTTHSAASPSGLAFDLSFDTEGLTSAAGLAQSDLEKTVLTLPEGVTIDPSAGVGLGACTEAQYAEATLDLSSGAGCPEDSKLGTVEIETPLLFTTVYGSLYLAQPYENPFGEPGHPGGSLLALYVVARSRAERGILVRLAGKVTPNPVTGQLDCRLRIRSAASVFALQLPLPRRSAGAADHPRDLRDIHHAGVAHTVLRAILGSERHRLVSDHLGV